MKRLIIIGLLISWPAHSASRKIPVTHCWSTLTHATKSINSLWSETLMSTGTRYENGFTVSRFANTITGLWTRTDTSPLGITCITDAGKLYEAGGVKP